MPTKHDSGSGLDADSSDTSTKIGKKTKQSTNKHVFIRIKRNWQIFIFLELQLLQHGLSLKNYAGKRVIERIKVMPLD